MFNFFLKLFRVGYMVVHATYVAILILKYKVYSGFRDTDRVLFLDFHRRLILFKHIL